MKTTDRERRYKKAYRKKMKAEDKARVPWWKDRECKKRTMEIYNRVMGEEAER